MNLKNFNTRIKVLFVINVIFLLITFSAFITYLTIDEKLQKYFLFITFWFATATTLLFHYLLWKNLPFFQQIDFEQSSHYSIGITLIFYTLLFPLLCILSVVFLLIFNIILIIMTIIRMFNKNKSNV